MSREVRCVPFPYLFFFSARPRCPFFFLSSPLFFFFSFLFDLDRRERGFGMFGYRLFLILHIGLSVRNFALLYFFFLPFWLSSKAFVS